MKAYQKEIDALTKRAEYAGKAFASLASELLAAPDPQQLLGTLKEVLPRYNDTMSDNGRLKQEIEALEAEFKDLKNQEITIRKLQAKVTLLSDVELHRRRKKGVKSVTVRQLRRYKDVMHNPRLRSERHSKIDALVNNTVAGSNSVSEFLEAVKSELDQRWNQHAHDTCVKFYKDARRQGGIAPIYHTMDMELENRVSRQTEVMKRAMEDVLVNQQQPPAHQLLQNGNERIRVVTYNLLAAIYATNTQYPYCPQWALSWNFRKDQIVRELAGRRYCIQCRTINGNLAGHRWSSKYFDRSR